MDDELRTPRNYLIITTAIEPDRGHLPRRPSCCGERAPLIGVNSGLKEPIIFSLRLLMPHTCSPSMSEHCHHFFLKIAAHQHSVENTRTPLHRRPGLKTDGDKSLDTKNCTDWTALKYGESHQIVRITPRPCY